LWCTCDASFSCLNSMCKSRQVSCYGYSEGLATILHNSFDYSKIAICLHRAHSTSTSFEQMIASLYKSNLQKLALPCTAFLFEHGLKFSRKRKSLKKCIYSSISIFWLSDHCTKPLKRETMNIPNDVFLSFCFVHGSSTRILEVSYCHWQLLLWQVLNLLTGW